MPTLLFTDQSIAALPLSTSATQTWYWDTHTNGFGVCVGRRRKTFLVRKNINGKHRKVTIGHADKWDVASARERAVEIGAALDLKKEKFRQSTAATGAIVSLRVIAVYENGAERELRRFAIHSEADLMGFESEEDDYLAFVVRHERRKAAHEPLPMIASEGAFF